MTQPRRLGQMTAGLIFLAAGMSAHAQVWNLAWEEEFLGSSLNTSSWTPENRAWPHNDERQYYSPSAISVSNGRGIITSTNVPQGGRLYTSGRMDTNGKREFLFGKFEMRARLPRTQGIWPAFWLLPAADQWPPEIDIMEMLGHEPNRVYGSNHWGTVETHTYQTSPFQLGSVNPNFATTFNTFSCEWWPDRIDFFVNGNLYATHRSRVPQEPMFIIVNTAVGGFWPGYPDATTAFPQRFEIDWIRVWQTNEPKLMNPGFEWPGPANSGQRAWHWQHWGNAEYSEALKRSGVGAAKMYGNFNTPNNTSGFYQDMPAVSGQVFTASAKAQTPSWDKMGAGTQARIAIEFRNSGGTVLTTTTRTVMTSSTPANVWQDVNFSAIAPSNAATARIVLSFLQGAQLSGGAAWWDDVTFERESACDSIDFDRDGVFPADSDVTAFFSVLAGGTCTTCGDMDFNNNGVFPEDQDVIDFFNVLAGGTCQ
ncbi:MAG TPA: glycoside hydrolase family 16 protein [Phycisphaerales bacterium]|nr:glycoside hydrolase family 16 protein [Phycisphaerales bacterium]